jgi:hypothetical protein
MIHIFFYTLSIDEKKIKGRGRGKNICIPTDPKEPYELLMSVIDTSLLHHTLTPSLLNY